MGLADRIVDIVDIGKFVPNLNITQFYAIGVDAGDTEMICGGSQDNSSLARSSSDVWDLQAVTGDGFVCHIDPQDLLAMEPIIRTIG